MDSNAKASGGDNQGAKDGSSPAKIRRRVRYTENSDAPPREQPAGDELHRVDSLDVLIQKYQRQKKPIDISFREEVSRLPYGERATHFLHPYPAKLLLHIPAFFFQSNLFRGRPLRVLDPFCGSGTTLLEAALNGHDAVGFDVNPFASLLSRTKCTPLDPKKLLGYAKTASSKTRIRAAIPDIPNPDLWYEPSTLNSLSKLRAAILRIEEKTYQEALLVALSACARFLSLADPRMPVPVRVRPEATRDPSVRLLFERVVERSRCGDARPHFLSAVKQMANRFASLEKIAEFQDFPVVSSINDSIIAPSPSSEQVLAPGFDLILTSPPYCGAQKYVRSTSLAMGWLGLSGAKKLSSIEARTIGREHVSRANMLQSAEQRFPAASRLIRKIEQINPVRACIASLYLAEMQSAFRTCSKHLRENGYMIVIAGDNTVAGLKFPTGALLRQMLRDLGFECVLHLRDQIRSRGLLTKRRGDSAMITHEHVFVMRRSTEHKNA